MNKWVHIFTMLILSSHLMIKLLRTLFHKSEKPATRVVSEPRLFTLPPGIRVYAIGDIHGKADLLKAMLEAIEEDARQHPDQLIFQVFLGDYIDRGLQSKEVIELLIQPPPAGHQRICLMGNHEETLLKFLRAPETLRDWGSFGGYATLASYGVDLPPDLSPKKRALLSSQLQLNMPASHLKFIQGLRLFYELGDYLFVHAGIKSNIPLEQQGPDTLLWIRDSFLSHKQCFGRYIVHGHSAVAEPQILENRANIDVSDAAVESLCCLAINATERKVILMTSEPI